MARTRLNSGAVDQVLSDAAPNGPDLRLDLGSVDAVERHAGVMLGNALLGSWGAKTLRLSLPQHDSEWLIASGLAFAVANRQGLTLINGQSVDALRGSSWARSWLPKDGQPGGEAFELFSPDEVEETPVRPDVGGNTFAAFVNPHLVAWAGQRHPVTTTLWPWIDRIVPGKTAIGRGRERRRTWIADIGRFVDEVVGNVCEHATGYGELHSLVQVSVTRGGGQASFDRLHINVQDTGPGIAATAREKLMGRLEGTLSDTDLVQALIDGSLAPWGRARGQGLPHMAQICRAHGGTMHLATGRVRARVEPRRLRGHRQTATEGDFDLKGTVVSLMVPVFKS